jgi:phosphatidylinositol alpha-mannosyltransferase
MASEYEAGPITLLEAMCFYDVAVSSRIDGIPALMTDYKDGLLFPVGDSAYLGKCLQQLINDPALCSKLSTSARVFAEKFDWKIIAEQTKKIYQELL